MSETLYIRLGCEAHQACHWLIWSQQEKEIIASGELVNSTELETISSHATSRKVVVFVSGQGVNLTSVSLPEKAQRKFQQAIPYMLEEELAEDVDDCVFMYHNTVDNAQQVLVVSRQQMSDWLSWLTAAEIQADVLTPDVLAMPLQEDACSAIQLNDEVIVRQSEWQGFVAQSSWLNHALAMINKERDSRGKLHTYSPLLIETDTELRVETPELPLMLLAKSTAYFNMLQGEFKRKKESNTTWHIWRNAAVLAGVALLANVGIKGAELVALNSQQQTLKDQIRQTFVDAFPETRRVVNVRSQLKQKLAALGQGDSTQSVLMMMSGLQPALEQTRLSAETLRFDGKRGELRLQAKASNFNDFESFKRLAESAGFDVTQGAINNRDGAVVGSISIKYKA